MGEDDRAFARLKQRPSPWVHVENARGPKPVMDGGDGSDIASGHGGDARWHSRSMRVRTGRDLSFCEPASHRVRFDVSMTNAIRQVKQRGKGTEARGEERDSDPEAARGVFPEAVVPAPDAFHRDRFGIGEWIAGIRRSTRPWRRAIGIWFTRSDSARN